MHQSEIAIHEIEVITQTLASRIDQLRSLLSRNHLETLARLKNPEDTDQPLSDSVTFGNLFSVIVLAKLSVDVFKRASECLCEFLGMDLQPLRLLLHELAEVFDEQPLPTEQSFHGIRPANRQIALEQHSIKTGDDSRDTVVILFDKRIHSGVLLDMVS